MFQETYYYIFSLKREITYFLFIYNIRAKSMYGDSTKMKELTNEMANFSERQTVFFSTTRVAKL